MTNRTPKTIQDKIVLCEDGTMWKWISGDFMIGIPAHWYKLPPIPSDDEYENQCKEIDLKYDQHSKMLETQHKEIFEKCGPPTPKRIV